MILVRGGNLGDPSAQGNIKCYVVKEDISYSLLNNPNLRIKKNFIFQDDMIRALHSGDDLARLFDHTIMQKFKKWRFKSDNVYHSIYIQQFSYGY